MNLKIIIIFVILECKSQFYNAFFQYYICNKLRSRMTYLCTCKSVPKDHALKNFLIKYALSNIIGTVYLFTALKMYIKGGVRTSNRCLMETILFITKI